MKISKSIMIHLFRFILFKLSIEYRSIDHDNNGLVIYISADFVDELLLVVVFETF